MSRAPSLTEQIVWAERELERACALQPKLARSGVVSHEQAHVEIATLTEILRTLRACEQAEAIMAPGFMDAALEQLIEQATSVKAAHAAETLRLVRASHDLVMRGARAQ